MTIHQMHVETEDSSPSINLELNEKSGSCQHYKDSSSRDHERTDTISW